MSLKRKRVGMRPKSNLGSLSIQHGLPDPGEAYFTTRDGATLRYAHWKTCRRVREGGVLFLNGRTEFIEKAIETYAILVSSGLDVWTLDWRGQGLSERFLADEHKGHIKDYQTYLDDLDQFLHEITDIPKGQGKRLMLGHSMGGHLGLRYLHDHPGLIEKAVLLAPMIDISVNKAPLRALNRTIVRLGLGETYALGTGRFKPIFENPDDPDDNGTIEDYRLRLARYQDLSRDPGTRAEIERCVRENPALAVGGPTSTWLDATFHSISITWAPGYAEAITTPVLMIGGGRDRTVVRTQQEKMATRLPNGKSRVIERGAHELLMECEGIRREVFQAFSDWMGVEINMTT